MRSHKLKEGTRLMPCTEPGCRCKCFSFIPGTGSMTIKCSCKHNPEDHNPDGLKKCRKCSCAGFNSTYRCDCGQPYSAHKTMIETTGERIRSGRSAGMTFASLAPTEQPKALTGSSLRSLESGSSRQPATRSARPVDSEGAGAVASHSGSSGMTAYDLMMTPHTLFPSSSLETRSRGSYSASTSLHSSAFPSSSSSSRTIPHHSSIHSSSSSSSTPSSSSSFSSSSSSSSSSSQSAPMSEAQRYAQKKREQMEHARKIREQRELEKRMKEGYGSLS
ncbi:putative Protein FAM221A/B [Monocercomonoides exilis]|uniref:putative Protein FAM221A/B n=1 Tax=Monocercomonoides exilis TaxID=2049356 RepID=UPI003559AD10|nr:putative Protein FAM221A/B [Monocercomonoides exilis]|eukprot:MONOS_757.1-p1 / transcript=MONOS_757.1 / gene=MONOS_757 / organism=Monocercomonoides_exilis_PA203 / gene_product=unspecified product / transcript_product=unspecified product / location=Mono_scaffold00012:250522-251624(+) / protein_length=275 / sequence_SO=supercontig / SO=protein_coding / is_pseudo=false